MPHSLEHFIIHVVRYRTRTVMLLAWTQESLADSMFEHSLQVTESSDTLAIAALSVDDDLEDDGDEFEDDEDEFEDDDFDDDDEDDFDDDFDDDDDDDFDDDDLEDDEDEFDDDDDI